MVKSVGVSNPAATVCPSSTARLITTPSIGDVMVAYPKLRRTLTMSALACS